MGQGLGQDMAKLLKSILNMKYIPFFLTHSEYQLDWWLQQVFK